MFPNLVRLHPVLVGLTENTTVVPLGLCCRLFRRLLLHLPADLWTGAASMASTGWLIDCGMTWTDRDLHYPHSRAAYSQTINTLITAKRSECNIFHVKLLKHMLTRVQSGIFMAQFYLTLKANLFFSCATLRLRDVPHQRLPIYFFLQSFTSWRSLTLKLRRDPFKKKRAVILPRGSNRLWKLCSVPNLFGAALVRPRADTAEAHGAKQPRLFTLKFP